MALKSPQGIKDLYEFNEISGNTFENKTLSEKYPDIVGKEEKNKISEEQLNMMRRQGNSR